MRLISSLFTIPAVLIAASLMASCGESDSGVPASSVSAATSPTEVPWLLTAEPADEAQSVTEAKASAKEGDVVIIRARVGGRAEPMSEGSPVFTVMDLAVPSCADMEEDHCATPWDYCCETPESIKANAATVQVVNADGTASTTSPMAGGVHPLDEVIIVGAVGPRPTADVLTIRATGVYRVGG
ncbi:MAG: hypothetical protein CMJ31_08300 [Phycisphaerae bacterium]|nr:hypothetical protein [Phycisphaerae bacterium]